MRNLYLASKNKGKIKEYKKLLSTINCKLLLQPESLEVEENCLTFRDNAIKKASEVSRKTNNFAIADDSGICIEALDGKPGIYSSRYAENDQKRIERVLKELNGLKNRSAFFIANICVCSPNGEVIIESEAKCHGNIIFRPRGKGGFGYDPIFEETSNGLTFAEMNNVMKDSCSHRAKALKKIIPDLLEIFS
ncbi:RdgB/HAM1 family non-canonical purine NTP pyrophosphatase [uncultured Prochlorococcus sp.]|uniref:RdgB/HAM1 family non-canonical purine NTP pyrophosphatase n=1 Tax=uncultured Prochlorococcus sp. TaxID=159733 RepID=UPI002586479D|nr:RdgB/HAM1 family non-canonical purine NTP pyrophosphatase [uncultured Prochlorococcus sp.]